MKNTLLWAVTALTVLVLANGCVKSRMASGPLTNEQAEWDQLIKSHYPAWKTPYISPIRGENDTSTHEYRAQPQSVIPTLLAPKAR